MGRRVGRYLLFIYYFSFIIKILGYFLIKFFGCPIFWFNLTSQKDHLMVNKKNNQVVKCDQMSK
jgi:hypothetical protein